MLISRFYQARSNSLSMFLQQALLDDAKNLYQYTTQPLTYPLPNPSYPSSSTSLVDGLGALTGGTSNSSGVGGAGDIGTSYSLSLPSQSQQQLHTGSIDLERQSSLISFLMDPLSPATSAQVSKLML